MSDSSSLKKIGGNWDTSHEFFHVKMSSEAFHNFNESSIGWRGFSDAAYFSMQWDDSDHGDCRRFRHDSSILPQPTIPRCSSRTQTSSLGLHCWSEAFADPAIGSVTMER
jgi:hypothetical protein